MNKKISLPSQEDLQNKDDAETMFQYALYWSRVNEPDGFNFFKPYFITKEYGAKKDDFCLVKPSLDNVLNFLNKSSTFGNKEASYCLAEFFSYDNTSNEIPLGMYESFLELAENIGKSIADLDANKILSFVGTNTQSENNIDYVKAKEYLLRITDFNPIKSNELLDFNSEYQTIIKVKLTWARDYLKGSMVEIDEQKSVLIAQSVCSSLREDINIYLDKVHNISIIDLDEKQIKLFEFFYQQMRSAFSILFKFIGSNLIQVDRDIFNNSLFLIANLSSINKLSYDYSTAYQTHGSRSNEEFEIKKAYPRLSRHNPDGDINNPIVTHQIKHANVYNWYFNETKTPKFDPKSIEEIVLKYNSIKQVLNSKELAELKEIFFYSYMRKVPFTYYYCLLLTLNDQYDEALSLYNKNINEWKAVDVNLIDKISELGKNHLHELKQFNEIMTFEQYKKDILSEIIKKDPLYIYKYNLHNNKFNQKDFENYITKSKVTKETFDYINALLNGGKFLEFKIDRNKEKAIKLLSLLADEVLKAPNNYAAKILKSYIKQKNSNKDTTLFKYYYALAASIKDQDNNSDFVLLTRLIYDKDDYADKVNNAFRNYKLMLTGRDFYSGQSKNNKNYKLSYDIYSDIYEEDSSFHSYQNRYEDEAFYRNIYPENYNARKEFNELFSDIINQLDLSENPIDAYRCIASLKFADIWKNNNSAIMSWLASNHFKNYQNNSDYPFDARDCKDDAIKVIVESIKNDKVNIDFTKAIEVDNYKKYQQAIENCLIVATDGNIKIPEVLMLRALLYLNKSEINNLDNNLFVIINEMYSEYLMIDLAPDSIFHTECNTTDDSIVYPCFNVLEQSDEYPISSSCKYTVIDLFNKSLTYLNYLVEKNHDGEYFYSCHQSLVDKALPLKYALETKLHIQKMKEIHTKEKELEVKQAKQDAAIEKEREMLSFLTHTLRNSLANGPAQLKQSIRLLGTDDYDESNSKYKAINNIVSQLSTFSVVNTLITTFKQYVGDQESFKQQWYDDNQGKADIDWVINFCLRQCVSRALFFPNYQRVIKRLVINNSNAHIKEIRKDYIENILSITDENEASKIVNQWICSQLPQIEVSTHGKSPAFSVNGTKFTYLFSIFSEVIWNAFKHTDEEHSINISWTDTGKDYCLEVVNHFIEDEINIESSTNKGLVFIERLLSMFEQTSFEYSKSIENSFLVRINLPYNVFS